MPEPGNLCTCHVNRFERRGDRDPGKPRPAPPPTVEAITAVSDFPPLLIVDSLARNETHRVSNIENGRARISSGARRGGPSRAQLPQ